MKTKFLLSTVLVLASVLAACAPQAAATKKAAEPPAGIPVTGASATPAASSKSSSTTAKNTTTGPTPKAGAPTPTTFAPGTSTAPQQPSATLTPGPALTNDIAMDDQAVKSGVVLVSMVDSLQPGWVAIFADDNGQPGKLLGYTAVPAGTSEDVQVKVDAGSVTPKMIAMLLTDAGQVGTFEYPGADQPVKNANMNENVMASFNRISQ